MTPTEIKQQFSRLQAGEINLNEYKRLIAPSAEILTPPKPVAMEKSEDNKSQAQRLLALLIEKKRVRTDEIMARIYGSSHIGTCRIASRIDDLRNQGWNIPPATRDRDVKTLWWYEIIV